MNEHRGVATVVKDHVGASLGSHLKAPVEDLVRAPPVLFERLALPGEHRRARRLVDRTVRAHCHGSRGLVLGGENVARCPAHLRTERRQRFDEHSSLHRHVQRTGNTGTLERGRGPELCSQRHESRHFVLGEANLVTTGLSEREVGNLELCGGQYARSGQRHVTSPFG